MDKQPDHWCPVKLRAGRLFVRVSGALCRESGGVDFISTWPVRLRPPSSRAIAHDACSPFHSGERTNLDSHPLTVGYLQ